MGQTPMTEKAAAMINDEARPLFSYPRNRLRVNASASQKPPTA